jgi:predicted RNA-binding protein with PIN domain
MADIQRMCGTIDNHETLENGSVLTGTAPVSEMRDYAAQVTAYTRGQGHLACTLRGYDLCHNSEEVLAASSYEPQHDIVNPADSVFCAHGAGVNIKWDEVPAHAHVDSGLRLGQKSSVVPPQGSDAPRRSYGPVSGAELDKELEAIFEKTYGPIKNRSPRPLETPRYQPEQRRTEKSVAALRERGTDYLLVDGYNIIFAWDDLKLLARESLESARQKLMDILCNYQGWRGCNVILVFDAYKVPHGTGEVEKYHNIHVVYTKEAETADAYIEKATFELSKSHRVTVATSDSVEQLIILGHGALRISARSFRQEVEQARVQMESALAEHNRQEKSPNVRDALEKAGWEKA